MNISDLLKRPEGKTLEFKRDLSSIKPIVKTLIAFANTAGGQNKVLDIAAHWKISERTAKPDITELKEHGIIEYAGSAKKGFYRIKQSI